MNEKERKSEFTPLGEIVDKMMKAYRLDGKLKEIEVLNKWEEMMGKAVALRTRSLFINGKVLILELDSSVMREELHNGKSIIIQRVNETAGFEIINDIWFK
jgi:hypothetical protein